MISPTSFLYVLIARGKSPCEELASISQEATMAGTGSSLYGKGTISSDFIVYSYLQ